MMTICKTTVHVPHSPHLTTGTDGDVSCRFLPILPWFYMHWLVLGFMQFYQMCRFVYPQGCLLLSFYKHVHPPTPFAHSLTRGDHKSVCFSNFGMFYEWNNIQCNLSKLALSTNPDALEDLPKLSTCQHCSFSLQSGALRHGWALLLSDCSLAEGCFQCGATMNQAEHPHMGFEQA